MSRERNHDQRSSDSDPTRKAGGNGTPSASRRLLSRRDALRAGIVSLASVGAGCTDLESQSTESGSDGFDQRQNDTNATETSTPDTRRRDETPDTTEMELVVEDQFGGGELDTSTWRDKYPWDARTHNYNGYAAPENVYVENDRLVLEAEDRPTKDRDYTTGVVSAKEVFAPGYFEASIKIPPLEQGFWPAYWLTSASYHPPEIDIFEFFGEDPQAYMTYHYANSNGEKRKVRETWEGPAYDVDFHTYSVDWNPPERIVWYIDGVERFRYDGKYVSDEYCYLILNFGIDRPGDPPPRSETLPATYEVDWIRCWER